VQYEGHIAKALGLTIPPLIWERADEVIDETARASHFASARGLTTAR
jgi:hypothetical protein